MIQMAEKKRKRRFVVVIAAVVILIVAIGGAFVLQSSNAHEHDWEQITGTTHHSEIGHMATYCSGCNEEITGNEEGHTRQCTVTHKTESYYQRYIVDSPAYDEPRIIGYRCTICDEMKD